MPEGDTIFRAARTLHRALAGQLVTRFETALAPLAQLDRDDPIAGRHVEKVDAVGKHCLITFSGPPPRATDPVASDGAVAPQTPLAAEADGVILRTHMRMNGAWHIYRPGERWQMPRHAMRIVIETADWVAVAFNVYSAEFIAAGKRDRHRTLATLGPDLLGDFDRDSALARIRGRNDRPAHEVLLDQRVMAGIGNVYKSELLFLSRIHPDTLAGSLDDRTWLDLMDLARKLLQSNVASGASNQIVTYRGLRRTTGRMNPEDRLWVYSRGGLPCRRCGARISSRKDGDDARVTYWCERCQPLERG
jgi:endonuclease-8